MARKTSSAPSIGDRVRVFVDASMIDEPGEVVRVGRDGEVGVHLWPDDPTRVSMSGVQWCSAVDAALAHGVRGCWPA